MRVSKYHALGNSYLVLDPRDINDVVRDLFETSALDVQAPKKTVVKTLCQISTGIGSNGLLFGPLPSGGAFGMLVINSDGTSAGFSGNGTRIFAQYLLDCGDVHYGQSVEVAIAVEHGGRPPAVNVARVRLPKNGAGPIEVTAPHAPRFGASAVCADPAFGPKPKDISEPALRYFFPALARIGSDVTGIPDAWDTSVLLDIGNPHCVTFVAGPDQLPDFDMLRRCDGTLRDVAFKGPAATSPFANGTNLQWAWPESRSRLHVSIYERGEGPTPASGSSACAAACAAFALGLVDNRLDVIMPGGTLGISVEGRPAAIQSVTLSGYATKILEGIAYLPPQEDSPA